MKLAKLNLLLVDKVVAVDIKAKDGRRLIKSGTLITQPIVERLQRYGMSKIYIEDDNNDVELDETISENKREAVLVELRNIYKKIKLGYFNEYEIITLIRNHILSEIKLDPISLFSCNTTENDLAEHSLNVCLLTMATARQMQFHPDKIELLGEAALLHDIGKVLINKNNMDHATLAYEFIKARAGSILVYTAVKCHHETIDGMGPLKFDPQNLTDMMKILCLCNYYENMVNEKGLLPHECFEEIQALVNIKFDKEVFEAFRKSVYLYPVGLPVSLSNGHDGIIVKQNKSFPIRPVVRLYNGEDIDLLKNLSVFIDRVNL